MRIGFIGAGKIGSTLARLAVEHGHDVVLSNSRGPETLQDLVRDLGEHATASTPEGAEQEGDVVVVTVPLRALEDVPTGHAFGKVVIDTENYYPDRDGHFPELDEGRTTSSELLARHLPGAKVVKAFNSIRFDDLGKDGKPAGTKNRRALPIAGDDTEAKRVVARLINEFGYDVVDAGPLAEGRRFQPGTPTYTASLTSEELRRELALA